MSHLHILYVVISLLIVTIYSGMPERVTGNAPKESKEFSRSVVSVMVTIIIFLSCIGMLCEGVKVKPAHPA
jgi:hypothetical protein